MSWQDEVDELNRQEQLAREMGGERKALTSSMEEESLRSENV